MQPPKQNITQKAIHVPQGEGKSLWIPEISRKGIGRLP
jgi:hypothetical protein